MSESESNALPPKTLSLAKAVRSTVGKKFVMALTGLALGLFVITHLLGNLSLYLPVGITFNEYAHSLEKLGVLLYIAEIGLLVAVIVHVLFAFSLTIKAKLARPVGYHSTKSKKGPSKSSVLSRNMAITGSLLLAFLILHVWQFKYGPGLKEGYVTLNAHGEVVRDLYRLVKETFSNPVWVTVYVVSMLFLGSHLRHGYWSLFQSLGANNVRISKFIYCISLLLAAALALGFLFIPIWIYFGMSLGAQV